MARKRQKGLIGFFVNEKGYMVLTRAARSGMNIYWHKVVAENMIGKPLEKRNIVHHIDGDRLNNLPWNLMICRDRKLHNNIHRMQKAHEATGDLYLRQCDRCGVYGNPTKMKYNNQSYIHRECRNLRFKFWKFKRSLMLRSGIDAPFRGATVKAISGRSK